MKSMNRKTRPDKFPLTLHTTGQHCKKINAEKTDYTNARAVRDCVRVTAVKGQTYEKPYFIWIS